MKKILSFFLAVIMVAAMTVSAEAAAAGIRMDDVTLQEAEMVYIPVSLQTEVTGTAVGLSYAYDESVLCVVPEECAWAETGVLRDFSKTSHQAVWASDGAQKISGDLCVLAFRILNPESFQKTEVSCSVTVKNGTKTIGDYQDTAKITKICDHKYGQWESAGESGHIRKCSLCSGQELQSHDWDRGTQSMDPEKPNVTITTYKCKVCTAERVVEEETEPTVPDPTRPTHPVETEPDETRPRPSHPAEDRPEPTEPKPTRPENGNNPSSGGNGGSNQNQSSNHSNTTTQPNDYNQKQPTESAQEEIQSTFPDSVTAVIEGNDAAMSEQTRPMAIKVEEQETIASEEVSGEAPAPKGKSVIPWLVAGSASAASIAAVWLFVIKKKRF